MRYKGRTCIRIGPRKDYASITEAWGKCLDRQEPAFRSTSAFHRVVRNPAADLPLPEGTMIPAGYVVLQFGIRDSRPVKAYEKWSRRIPSTFNDFVLNQKEQTTLSYGEDAHCLGLLKHYRSLIPLAMKARKPIFHLKPSDGAIGALTYAVKDREEDFQNLADNILKNIGAKKSLLSKERHASRY